MGITLPNSRTLPREFCRCHTRNSKIEHSSNGKNVGQFLSVNNALGGGLMVNNVSVGCAGYMQILPEVMGDEIVAREHYINILGWPMHP